MATDNGRPQKESTSRVLLKVVAAPSRTSNAPVFLESHRSVTVLENFRVGQMVELVQASDPDGDRVWYSITGELRTMLSLVSIGSASYLTELRITHIVWYGTGGIIGRSGLPGIAVEAQQEQQ